MWQLEAGPIKPFLPHDEVVCVVCGVTAASLGVVYGAPGLDRTDWLVAVNHICLLRRVAATCVASVAS